MTVKYDISVKYLKGQEGKGISNAFCLEVKFFFTRYFLSWIISHAILNGTIKVVQILD